MWQFSVQFQAYAKSIPNVDQEYDKHIPISRIDPGTSYDSNVVGAELTHMTCFHDPISNPILFTF
jgi:hypothetical protein